MRLDLYFLSILCRRINDVYWKSTTGLPLNLCDFIIRSINLEEFDIIYTYKESSPSMHAVECVFLQLNGVLRKYILYKSGRPKFVLIAFNLLSGKGGSHCITTTSFERNFQISGWMIREFTLILKPFKIYNMNFYWKYPIRSALNLKMLNTQLKKTLLFYNNIFHVLLYFNIYLLTKTFLI